jgi:hypothetical protein
VKQSISKGMALTLQAEEVAFSAVSIYFLVQHSLGLSPWLWVLLFFAPDLSALGYLAGTRVGAFTYNLVHHKGVALALAAAGYFTHTEVLLSTGLLLFAHSSFDRMLGMGLKYEDDFKHTHLS